MIAGQDYIGVGVGALVFNDEGLIFLAQRGPQAKNERSCWEFPGGSVEFGERLATAIQREFWEEYRMKIEVIELLGVSDHILPDEDQHWVAPTFLARYIEGPPRIMEPEKCTAIGWFSMEDLPTPLSVVTKDNIKMYQRKKK